MLDQGKQERLRRYARLIREWAPRLDLVAPGDLPHLERRHIDDSLKLLPLLERLPPGPCVDVGSGAGFPGIPLAIAEPARRWRLIEPRKRRAAFLEEVSRTLSLTCEVIPTTVEDALTREGFSGAHALAVARAFAPPVAALHAISQLVTSGGAAAVFVGERADIPPEAEMWSQGVAIVRIE